LNKGIIYPNHIKQGLEAFKINSSICEYRLESILKPFKAVQGDFTSPFIQLSHNAILAVSRKPRQAAYTKPIQSVLSMGRLEDLKTWTLQFTASPLHLKICHISKIVEGLYSHGRLVGWSGKGVGRRREIMLPTLSYNSHISKCHISIDCTLNHRISFVSPLYNVVICLCEVILYRVCIMCLSDC